MAEFISKKLVLSSTAIVTPPPIERGGPLLQQLVHAFLKYQELYEDIVTLARTSQPVCLSIGIALLIMIGFITWLWIKKILPLV